MLLRLLNGTARLFVLLLLISWVGVAIYEWKSWSEIQEISVENNIHAFSVTESGEQRINRDSWPVMAARPAFLNSTVEEREQIAQEFYETRIQPKEEYYFLGHEGKSVKDWILYTARLSANDAPTREFRDPQGSSIQYRTFFRPYFNINPRFTYVISNGHVLGTSLILAAMLTIFTLIAIAALRWVYRGFVPKRRAEKR